MIQAAAPERRGAVTEQLARLWDPDRPEVTEFRGATTNPPLSLAAMRHDPDRWAAWIRTTRSAHPGADVEAVFWALYLEIVRLGAERLRPLFDSSGRRYGHLSGQVDPRSAFDSAAMLRQALDIAAQGPNVMVKIPGNPRGASDPARADTARYRDQLHLGVRRAAVRRGGRERAGRAAGREGGGRRPDPAGSPSSPT